MKNVIVLIFLAAVSQLAVACNTVEGAGKDIKSGGEAIEDVAK